MRSRRQTRPPLPGFALALPTASSQGEVHVQQKNEQEVNKFFVDVDDTMISPMITTNLTSSTFPTGRIAENTATRAEEPGRGAFPAPVTPSSGWAALLKPAEAPLATAKDFTDGTAAAVDGGAVNVPGAATAKFFHVNNTNLFVLMDGVSMFVEGRSTFTGKEDALFLQQLQRKKKEKKEREEKARLLHGESGACVPAGSPVDSVERAIRDIEQNVSVTRVLSESGVYNGKNSQPDPAQLALLAPAPMKNAATTPPRLKRIPSAFADLFVNATRPANQPLFGHRPAMVPSQPRATQLASHREVDAPVLPVSSTASVKSSATPREQARSLSELPPQADTHNFTASLAPEAFPSLLQVSQSLTRQSLTRQSHKRENSVSSQTSQPLFHGGHDGSSSSLSTMGGTESASRKRNGKGHTPSGSPTTSHRKSASATKAIPMTVEDIGHSNRSLDLDDVEELTLIGSGSQGKVYCVRLDGKFYALKCMDVKEALEATNSVERQGRKRGIVKELNMIRLQRDRPPPKYLMQMFNGVLNCDEDKQQLNLLIELMSFGVEDCQKMVARIPQVEMMRMTQSTFREYMARNTGKQQEVEKMLKQQHGSCMHVLGRSTHLIPEAWELNVERQTSMPEIVLSLLATDVLQGLKELHEDYNIVHCDLKPANVLLCFDRQSFKLADFGCGSVMDPETKNVRRTGVDLGSKLYKAPERISGELTNDVEHDSGASFDQDENSTRASTQVIEFTEKADVWSLGIMLLELSCGVHPCDSFKSDFWNYANQLKLSKMIKPLSWSSAFCDFIVRCVCVDVEKRWPVNKLLVHPFVLNYANVPRSKLRVYMDRLEKDSATFQRRQQRELLQEQIQLSTARLARDNYQRESRAKWKTFTGFLSVVPKLQDTTKFPELE